MSKSIWNTPPEVVETRVRREDVVVDVARNLLVLEATLVRLRDAREGGADLDREDEVCLVDGALAIVEQTLTLQQAMDRLNIPSVSLALIDQDRIGFTRAYGAGITPETLYQAASLSKFVAAVGAMRLVDTGQIALDQDVNDTLTSWKVPTNGFDHKVTLRGLISMTAGIGVPGFV